tara:strand:- start:1275 stop:1508 length:234 start_codon:yes stop_codon:yes gene_type:complete
MAYSSWTDIEHTIFDYAGDEDYPIQIWTVMSGRHTMTYLDMIVNMMNGKIDWKFVDTMSQWNNIVLDLFWHEPVDND